MKKINYITLLLAGTMLLMACGGTHDDKILAEDQLIAQFIAGLKNSGNIKEKVTNSNGVNHCIIEDGDVSQTINKGDSVYFYYIAAAMTSSSTATVYETNIKDIAEQVGLDIPSRNFSEKGVIAGTGRLISGLDNGLLMCCLNEQSYLIFDSDLGYGDKKMGVIPAYSPLIFQVIITRIKKN